MSLRDILVFLDAGPASAGRLRLAAGIAREHGSDLSAAYLDDGTAFKHAAAVPRFGLVAQLCPDATAARPQTVLPQEQRQIFRECLHGCGADGDWHHVEHGNSARLIDLARAADLIVLGQISPYLRPSPWWRTDEIVVAAGRPVLLVPYVGTYTEVGRRVLVAWDCSREAARALHDALPLIGRASAVTVMTVRTNGATYQHDRAATERVIRLLARHDIAARAEHPVRGSNAVSDVLLSAAMDFSADLLVAGAYHHSPLREALIGGVSRELLQTMTVPVPDVALVP